MALGVLIVEDEQEFRRYLTTAIPWEHYGLRLVGAVDDVEPARTLIATEPIDLVLLDVTLQRGNGLDLVTELKSREPPPRILVITGHSEFETVRRALRLGVDDYLLKPFARQELLMSVLANREHMIERIEEARHHASLQDALREGWLSRMMTGGTPGERAGAVRALADAGLRLPDAPRVVACSTVSPKAGGKSPDAVVRWTSHVTELWQVAVDALDAIVWTGLDGCSYAIVGGIEPQELAWEILDTARDLVVQAHRRLPVTVAVGISAPATDDFQTMYRQAHAARSRADTDHPVIPWDPSMGSAPTDEETTAGHGRHHLLDTATRFIEQYHHDPTLDVQTVAAHLGVSTEYLRRLFRSGLGITCSEAIGRRRIEHAKTLLRASSLSIREIARRSGFRDPGYCARQFRRHVGISPREYRNR